MSLYKDASLVMIPSAYKDGKLYSIRPTDGSGDFTFSRGSNLAATRVDVNGLIEKGRENQILYSQDFSNAAWSKGSHTIVSNAAVAPDGTTTADKLVADNGLDPSVANSSGVFQNRTIPTSLYNISVYAKAAEFTSIRFRENYVVGSLLTIDLTDGSITGGGSQYSDAKAVSVGNGWYRISFFYNQTTGNPAKYTLRCADTGDGTSGVYIWGYQQEQGLVATDYIETGTSAAQSGILEDMPRLDYSGGASCPSLLLEPQRSNLITQSEYFADSSWQKLASGTASVPVVTSNQGESPEGVNNASKVVFDRGAGTTSSDFSRLYFSSGSAPATASIYIKSFDGTEYDMYLVCGNAFNAILVTNEWQRFDATELTTGSNIQLRLQGNLGSESTAEVLVFGAQLEAGSYPTSYIPCMGTSQTRSYDNPFLTNVSSLIGQTQGSVLVELTRDALESYTQRIVTLSDGTDNNTIGLQLTSANSFSYYVTKDGVLQGLVTKTDATTANQKVKVAFAYAENDFVMYVDGVLAGTDTSGSIPAANTIKFQRESNGLHYVGLINQLSVFPTRLTNAELAALTTL